MVDAGRQSSTRCYGQPSAFGERPGPATSGRTMAQHAQSGWPPPDPDQGRAARSGRCCTHGDRSVRDWLWQRRHSLAATRGLRLARLPPEPNHAARARGEARSVRAIVPMMVTGLRSRDHRIEVKCLDKRFAGELLDPRLGATGRVASFFRIVAWCMRISAFTGCLPHARAGESLRDTRAYQRRDRYSK